MASPVSEAVKSQRMMGDLLGLSLNQWTAGGSETLHESSDFEAYPATYDMQDVSFANKLNKDESDTFSTRLKTSVTVDSQPTEVSTTEYITDRIHIINHGLVLVSD